MYVVSQGEMSQEESKETVKVGDVWPSGNPKKLLTGPPDSVDEFPMKKSTLKITLIGKEQKTADRNLVTIMKVCARTRTG